MRHIAFIIGLVWSSIALQAKTSVNTFEQIVIHSYDSLRIEMIKTACEIGGFNDSVFLKGNSERRDNLAYSLQIISKPMAQLITQSDKGLDVGMCDELARKIRANLMGWLLAQNYSAEDEILSNFDKYKRELDCLNAEISDFLKAEKEGDFTHFQEKHSNSSFHSLIPQKNKGKDAGRKNIILYIGVIAITLISMIAIVFLICELRKKNKALLDMQQRKGRNLAIGGFQERGDNDGTLSVRQRGETQQQECCHGSNNDGLGNTGEKVDVIGVNAFAEKNDGCVVVGTSTIGNSHISMGLPCQDNCKYTYIKERWGIAIVSDGAGSAKHSEIGSRIVVERGMHYFQSVIRQKKWIENNVLPTDAEWASIAYTTLKAIRDDMEAFANTKKVELGSLSATIIVVIHTPMGFLTTHVGDGRAGYKDDTKEWKSLITPHKGEEANQTIFLTSDFWKVPYYVMSGAMVPESHVVRCHPVAFTLMSDGCEHTAWQCNMRNEKSGMYYDPNKPYDRFFNPLIADLSNNMEADLKVRWARFIMSGNSSFKNEPDDKTMILGIIK